MARASDSETKEKMKVIHSEVDGFTVYTGETERKLPRLPEGNPVFTIMLDGLPSWNDIISVNNPVERSKIAKKERDKGYLVGLKLAKAFNIPTKIVRAKLSGKIREAFRDNLVRYITEKKLFCFVSVTRERGIKDPTRSNRTRDVYNPAVKALIDGLTDAGVWKDDNEEYHTDFWIHYSGLAESARIEISFYETRE